MIAVTTLVLGALTLQLPREGSPESAIGRTGPPTSDKDLSHA